MSEIDRMLNQLDRAFRDDAWHGPAVLEALAGVDEKLANARPLAKAHSIWELVLHMAFWKEIVRERLKGLSPQVDERENFPEIKDPSPAAWHRALARLETAHDTLRAEVARITDDQLDQIPVPGGRASRYTMIHGMVQHDLYHAGQIAILKKGRPASRKPAPKKAAKKAGRKAAKARKPARKRSKKRR